MIVNICERGTVAGGVTASALIKMLGQKILPVLQMLSLGGLLLRVTFEGGFPFPRSQTAMVAFCRMSPKACGWCLEDFPPIPLGADHTQQDHVRRLSHLSKPSAAPYPTPTFHLAIVWGWFCHLPPKIPCSCCARVFRAGSLGNRAAKTTQPPLKNLPTAVF